VLVVVISIGVSVLYGFLNTGEVNEGSSLYAKGKSIQEMEKDYRDGVIFEWLGHSLLSTGSISIQIKYHGPPLEHFSENDIDFLINRQPCTWYSQIVKGKGGRVTTLESGEILYIMVSFECAVKKGDTLTFVYKPWNLSISAQL
jgi:hypothetical protein